MANYYITNDPALLSAGTYTAGGVTYQTVSSSNTTINVSGNDNYLIDRDVSGTSFYFKPATSTTVASPTITLESGATGAGGIYTQQNGTAALSPTVNIPDGVNAPNYVISLSATNNATLNIGDQDGDATGAVVGAINKTGVGGTFDLNVSDNSTVGGIDTQSNTVRTDLTIGDNVTVNGTIALSNNADTVVIGDNVSVLNSNSILLNGGDDTLTVGSNLFVSGGTGINAGLGTDTLILTDGAYETTTKVLTGTITDADVESKQLYDNNNTTGVGGTAFTVRTFENYATQVCFARGTLILTDRGEVAVEALAEGDLVVTRDNGLQPVRWIGSNRLDAAALADNEKLRPILIRRHALGTNVPAQDLRVSPQHRVLVRSAIAQKMFGTDEVLVAAKQLCLVDGIDVDTAATEVEYFHILFDRHEVVVSNGAETESLYTGPEALKSVGPAAREEIFALFPELRDRDHTPSSARPLATGRMGRKLAIRHQQNARSLVC